MYNVKKLGVNIRSLRMAYEETQEQLGEVLGVEKTTVSNYENGKREPDNRTIIAIADHYMISVEELLNSDLSSTKKMVIDAELVTNNLEIFLPITISKRSLKNETFKKTVIIHKRLMDALKQKNYNYLINIFVCLQGYLEVSKDIDAKTEACANYVTCWYLLMLFLKDGPELVKAHAAILSLIEDEEIKKMDENDISDWERGRNCVLNMINYHKIKNRIPYMLSVIKRNTELSDLAYYYLALQYCVNIVDNDFAWGINQRIGLEMLREFWRIGNKYVDQLFGMYKKTNCENEDKSSQNVNDN